MFTNEYEKSKFLVSSRRDSTLRLTPPPQSMNNSLREDPSSPYQVSFVASLLFQEAESTLSWLKKTFRKRKATILYLTQLL